MLTDADSKAWKNTHRRFSRWAKAGVWEKFFKVLNADADFECLMIDSTVNRAHQHAAGAEKKRGPQSLGRSRGGFSTKIHAAVDALGNPVRLLLSPGQSSDIGQAKALIEGFDFDFLLGDKGYDSKDLEAKVSEKQAVTCIPSRKNCIIQRDYDQHLYKDRNLVERFFNLIKHFRRVATRYEKTDQNYLAMAHFASVIILLR